MAIPEVAWLVQTSTNVQAPTVARLECRLAQIQLAATLALVRSAIPETVCHVRMSTSVLRVCITVHPERRLVETQWAVLHALVKLATLATG